MFVMQSFHLGFIYLGFVVDIEELGIRWNITRQTASSNCNEIRKALLRSFCLQHISFSVPRDDLISHQSFIAKSLHGSSGPYIILVWDGTYIFIQKSSNFSFQRNTYSGHKHRNLIKWLCSLTAISLEFLDRIQEIKMMLVF